MSAVIPVNKDYRIELDAMSWQVSKWKPRKTHPNGGNFEGIAWYPTLQQAGESLVKRLVSTEDLEGLDEVISALHASSVLVATAIKECPYADNWSRARELLDSSNG
jgi:hypothetical protein